MWWLNELVKGNEIGGKEFIFILSFERNWIRRERQKKIAINFAVKTETIIIKMS